MAAGPHPASLNERLAKRPSWTLRWIIRSLEGGDEYAQIFFCNRLSSGSALTRMQCPKDENVKNLKQNIRSIVRVLNNSDENGGFWLPNIQRPFVWSEEQICRLFDSILREYPISTLLVWRTTSNIRRRKFIDNWKPSLRLSDFFVPEDSKKKCLVLDGQQRLQSLFIGLCGSYSGKELYFDILSGQVAAPDDIKYRFAFIDKDAKFPWVNFKNLVFTTKRKREIVDNIRDSAGRPMSVLEQNKVDDHIDLIDRSFKMNETITYQELDSIDNPNLYNEDDVVEIFIRANSGGTKLGKSDLLFSLLNATWEVANENMEELLESLNRHGFRFDRDFVLKTCLVLLGQKARYDVEKFRRAGVREDIEKNWIAISDAIKDVLDQVRSRTYIQCDKALPSYLSLIPLVYARYKWPGAWKTVDFEEYLLRSLLAGAFSGQPDNLIDALTTLMDHEGRFEAESVFNTIRTQGRSLDLTEDRLWQMGYGSDTIHLLFNLWYRQFKYDPAFDNNLPQVDHIFPQSELKQVKEKSSTSGRMVMKYKESDRNELANCMLLTREENGPSGKRAIVPSVWFASKPLSYLNMHLIPPDPNLWELDNFKEFIRARRALITTKFKVLLA